jgi:hypothetical protein
MKIQGAEMGLLGVAHAVAQVLDYPEAKLHDTVSELRDDASGLLTSLAARLREPKLDVRSMLAELKDGIVDLVAKAIEAGENPENEIDFSVESAKENLAVLLEYYAKEIQGGDGLKRLATHPMLQGVAKATLEAVGVGTEKESF